MRIKHNNWHVRFWENVFCSNFDRWTIVWNVIHFSVTVTEQADIVGMGTGHSESRLAGQIDFIAERFLVFENMFDYLQSDFIDLNNFVCVPCLERKANLCSDGIHRPKRQTSGKLGLLSEAVPVKASGLRFDDDECGGLGAGSSWYAALDRRCQAIARRHLPTRQIPRGSDLVLL